MTTLGDALRSAGLMPAADRLRAAILAALRNPAAALSAEPERNPVAEQRLHEVAMAAVKANPRNWDGARDALIRSVRNDAALLWELFAPYRNQALQAALTAAATELRKTETPRFTPRREDGAGHFPHGNQNGAARPSSARRGVSPAAVSAVTQTAAASLLDTFTVNGQPIGDLTPREANAWAGARERDARFVRLLTANLPDSLPIRRYRTGAEAAELYALAESDNE